MSPQLTLQTPLELAPAEVPHYLEQLWSPEQQGSTGTGANTFCLLIWQPAWAEQQLIRSGHLSGPITGQQSAPLIAAGRQAVLDADLPLSTPPLDGAVVKAVADLEGQANAEDLRGQYIDPALSALMPRRLITLAPTIDAAQPLETLVAAYCPLPEEGGGTAACGDVVVLRGGHGALHEGLSILDPLLPESMPAWVWWNGCIDEAPELMQRLTSAPRRLIIDTALSEHAEPDSMGEHPAFEQMLSLTTTAIHDLSKQTVKIQFFVTGSGNKQDESSGIYLTDTDAESMLIQLAAAAPVDARQANYQISNALELAGRSPVLVLTTRSLPEIKKNAHQNCTVIRTDMPKRRQPRPPKSHQPKSQPQTV